MKLAAWRATALKAPKRGWRVKPWGSRLAKASQMHVEDDIERGQIHANPANSVSPSGCENRLSQPSSDRPGQTDVSLNPPTGCGGAAPITLADKVGRTEAHVLRQFAVEGGYQGKQYARALQHAHSSTSVGSAWFTR